MEKKIVKKILAILMIIMIMSTDFFVLGSNLITYAMSSDNTTNHKNIEYSVYFKDSKGNKVDKLETSINAENLKLYTDITVKNDGYLNGILELQESNFKIKNNILSDAVESIDGNKVKLKQINAGTTVNIELDIEPLMPDTLSADMLLSASGLKLTGKYMETSYKGLSIEATKAVELNLQASESATAELSTEIITNKVFAIKGTNKRVVQLLVKSRLKDNEYPIKQTVINVSVPTLSEKQPEEVSVLSLGTMATNGETTLETEDWKNENGTVQITLKNEDSEIIWNKDAYDEIILTFIYAEDVDAKTLEVSSTSEITVHNTENKYTANYECGILNQEPNGIITIKSEIDKEEIYKGQLYANINAIEKKNVEYGTKSTVVISNANVAEKIVVKEGKDVFTTDSEEFWANTKYISTEINKEKMLEILGAEGNIEIKNANETFLLNKDSEVNESGNIVVTYTTASDEITITTSKIEKEGLLEIKHQKAMIENAYTRTQLQAVKNIKTNASVEGIITVNKVEEKVAENSVQATLELKETLSKAELTINKTSLSTITTNEDVVFGIKLITDGTKYDLYKNPEIKIQLPSVVENATIKGTPNKLYSDDFEVKAEYDNTNKIIKISLKGEQKEYPETSATQLYLQLSTDIKLEQTAPSKADIISMTYTNDNAIQYDGGTTEYGIIEKSVAISSPSGLVTMHNSDTYKITGIAGTSEDEQIIPVSEADAGKDVDLDISLVNNTSSKLNNVRIFGKLPTKGNKVINEENTLTTALKEISAPNATVYYTNNSEATADIEEASNAWSTTFASSAKKYMIVINELNEQSSYNAEYIVTLPETITRGLDAYAEYTVIYDTEIDKDIETNSVIIGFETKPAIQLEPSIVAQVGNDIIGNGDTVKVGEVIKYTIAVKNNGIQTLQNVQLKGYVPEGTVYVEPEADYVYSGLSYYEEKSEITSKTVTIPSLEAGQTYSETYEVRVKEVKEKITTKSNVICEDVVLDSEVLENKIEDAVIRVTIKRTKDLEATLLPLETIRYVLFIENLTDTAVKNLNIKINQQGIDNVEVIDRTEDSTMDDIITDISGGIDIDEVPARGKRAIQVFGTISKDVKENIKISADVTDSEGKLYRSNEDVQKVSSFSATVKMTTPNNGEYIMENDKITYEIVIKNTGEIVKTLVLVNSISEYLEVQEIYENGILKRQMMNMEDEETYFEFIDNKIEYRLAPKVGEEVTIKIIAKVMPIEAKFEPIRISNIAKVLTSDGEEVDVSEEVFHILKDNSEDGGSTGDNNNPGNNDTPGDNDSQGGNDNNKPGENQDEIAKTITGFAWLDENYDGQKDSNEKMLSDVTVQLFNIDANKVISETKTNEKGEYIFTEISSGEYIVIFDYDMNEYELTTYKAEGISESLNSKVVLKPITLDGKEYTRAVTDIIKINQNIANINIGLKENKIYDLELDKYISKIVVQNKKGTKEYTYNESTFEKVEIHRKQVSNSTVILEYTIKVKNTGEMPGYASNVKDYLPSGLEFKSELNPDWYLSGNNLFTKALANELIQPGEAKEIKLVLMKTMTEDNVGLINNRAEIEESYNKYGKQDIDSIEGNEVQAEDDFGKADVIIAISTGVQKVLYTILTIINSALIIAAIYLVFTKKQNNRKG